MLKGMPLWGIVILFAFILLFPSGALSSAYGHGYSEIFDGTYVNCPDTQFVDVVFRVNDYSIDWKEDPAKFLDGRDKSGETQILWKVWENGHEDKGGRYHDYEITKGTTLSYVIDKSIKLADNETIETGHWDIFINMDKSKPPYRHSVCSDQLDKIFAAFSVYEIDPQWNAGWDQSLDDNVEEFISKIQVERTFGGPEIEKVVQNHLDENNGSLEKLNELHLDFIREKTCDAPSTEYDKGIKIGCKIIKFGMTQALSTMVGFPIGGLTMPLGFVYAVIGQIVKPNFSWQVHDYLGTVVVGIDLKKEMVDKDLTKLSGTVTTPYPPYGVLPPDPDYENSLLEWKNKAPIQRGTATISYEISIEPSQCKIPQKPTEFHSQKYLDKKAFEDPKSEKKSYDPVPATMNAPLSTNSGILKNTVYSSSDYPSDTIRFVSSHNSELSLLPDWVKNNAGWWASDLITDSDFVKGIEFMVEEKIIASPSLKIVDPPTEQPKILENIPTVNISKTPKAEISIRGDVGFYLKGAIAEIKIHLPDGTTVTQKVLPELNGEVTSKYVIDQNSPIGIYTVKILYNKASIDVLTFQVISNNEIPISTKSSLEIPSWIKNNAEWWSQGKITNTDFIQGIEFMIKEKIIQSPSIKVISTIIDQPDSPTVNPSNPTETIVDDTPNDDQTSNEAPVDEPTDDVPTDEIEHSSESNSFSDSFAAYLYVLEINDKILPFSQFDVKENEENKSHYTTESGSAVAIDATVINESDIDDPGFGMTADLMPESIPLTASQIQLIEETTQLDLDTWGEDRFETLDVPLYDEIIPEIEFPPNKKTAYVYDSTSFVGVPKSNPEGDEVLVFAWLVLDEDENPIPSPKITLAKDDQLLEDVPYTAYDDGWIEYILKEPGTHTVWINDVHTEDNSISFVTSICEDLTETLKSDCSVSAQVIEDSAYSKMNPPIGNPYTVGQTYQVGQGIIQGLGHPEYLELPSDDFYEPDPIFIPYVFVEQKSWFAMRHQEESFVTQYKAEENHAYNDMWAGWKFVYSNGEPASGLYIGAGGLNNENPDSRFGGSGTTDENGFFEISGGKMLAGNYTFSLTDTQYSDTYSNPFILMTDENGTEGSCFNSEMQGATLDQKIVLLSKSGSISEKYANFEYKLAYEDGEPLKNTWLTHQIECTEWIGMGSNLMYTERKTITDEFGVASGAQFRGESEGCTITMWIEEFSMDGLPYQAFEQNQEVWQESEITLN